VKQEQKRACTAVGGAWWRLQESQRLATCLLPLPPSAGQWVTVDSTAHVTLRACHCVTVVLTSASAPWESPSLSSASLRASRGSSRNWKGQKEK